MIKKIAFCFLIYDTINHEEIWYRFFKNIDTNKYSIYIHYKTDKPLIYFNKYKLNNCIDTEWGKISLVEAQNLLLKEGLKDPHNTNFIFISNSCIPLKSFNKIYSFLSTDYSYFNLFPPGQCFPLCARVLNYIDQRYVNKSHQWCIINRKHSELMITYAPLYLEWFKETISGPDEYCYLTTIYYLHMENEIITTPHSATDATTFTNWINMHYRYNFNYCPEYTNYYTYDKQYNYYGLKNYNVLTQEELEYLLNSKCLFGRKFNQTINLLHYNNYISNIS
jgi:hypothetical protein